MYYDSSPTDCWDKIIHSNLIINYNPSIVLNDNYKKVNVNWYDEIWEVHLIQYLGNNYHRAIFDKKLN